MARAQYLPLICKSAINRVQGMPFKWSLNPYRGCVHACHYCYARATHTYYGLNADRDFETRIFYKSNIATVLDRELSRRGWNGEQIAIGTATDAYQPAEGKFRLTRQCLETLVRHRNPASIVTKSTLIVRDLDVLKKLAGRAEVTVYFTVTTIDDNLWRIVEPGTPPPLKRLASLRKLADAGISCGVLMAPVMPGLTDTPEAIQAVAAAASEHGAQTFSAIPLRLAAFVKEHYFQFLDREFPDLVPWYLANFHGVNLPDDIQNQIKTLSIEIAGQYGLSRRSRMANPPSDPAIDLNQFHQLSFPVPPALLSRYDPLSA